MIIHKKTPTKGPFFFPLNFFIPNHEDEVNGEMTYSMPELILDIVDTPPYVGICFFDDYFQRDKSEEDNPPIIHVYFRVPNASENESADVNGNNVSSMTDHLIKIRYIDKLSPKEQDIFLRIPSVKSLYDEIRVYVDKLEQRKPRGTPRLAESLKIPLIKKMVVNDFLQKAKKQCLRGYYKNKYNL